MSYRIECIPNVSTADPAILQRIATAIEATEGVTLHFVDPGKSANRTVFTYLGPASQVIKATEALFAIALSEIDMRNHQGVHPRMGAVDVCPFVLLDDETFELESLWLPGDLFFEGKVNGQAVSLAVDTMPEGYVLTSRGKAQEVFVRSLRAQELMVFMPEKTDGASSKELLCPMPGVVMSIDVEEGQEVKSGQALAVVEAMKMQNVIRSPRAGVITKFFVEEGSTLVTDETIMKFGDEEQEEAA